MATIPEKTDNFVGDERELENESHLANSKYAGTTEDERDMRVLGKAQVLNVSSTPKIQSIGRLPSTAQLSILVHVGIRMYPDEYMGD